MFEIILSGLLLLGREARAESKDHCLDWFKKSELSKGSDCEVQCASISVDMGSFDCPSRCEDFCRTQTTSEKILGTLAYYPSLNPVERTLIATYPREAIAVYRAKKAAEESTNRLFKRNAVNDESDALRHFIWAASMRKDLSAEVAKKFLDAHESDEPASDPARAMDLANNRAGLLAAEKLLKKKKLNPSEIEKEALSELKKGNLVVLKTLGGPQ